MLPNVICSSVIEGKVRTLNMLDGYVNLTRTSDDKIFVDDNAQLVIKDIMATNGVLHVTDKVVIPDACKSLYWYFWCKGLMLPACSPSLVGYLGMETNTTRSYPYR